MTQVDKVQEIIQCFKNENVYFIVLVGKGGCGKSYSLQEATRQLPDISGTLIWNQGELPHFLKDGDGSITKFVITRFMDDDMVKSIVETYPATSVIKF